MDIWRWSADWIEWIFCYISCNCKTQTHYLLSPLLPPYMLLNIALAVSLPPRTYPDVTTKKSMMFHMFRM